MDLEFENPRHEKQVNNFNALVKKYDKKGQVNAINIQIALDVLFAADTLADVPSSFRPHPMRGGGKGLFTIDVDSTHRVVFRSRMSGARFHIDNYKTVTSITITDIFFQIH